MLGLYILIFIVSVIVLIYSGGKTVAALVRISLFLKLREFIVAFVLMAFTTSIPELFVGVISALNKIPQLAFSAIVGSNIIKLTLAVGLPVLILGGLNMERNTTRRNLIFVATVALLPLFLILDGDLSRIDGVVLFLAFVFYTSWLFSRKEMFTRIYHEEEMTRDWLTIKKFLKDLGIFAISVVMLLLSAEGVIRSASFFVESMGVSLSIVGILLVGAGTALPEVYFSIRSGKSGHQDMILGNLMGGVVITSTLVLGLIALISPIKITDFSPYGTARLFLLLAVLFFLFVSRTQNRISTKEGLFLIIIYLIFVFVETLLR